MKFFTYCSSQPSLKIFLNTLPRSGSKYLAHTLANALQMSRMVISLQHLGDDLLVPKWVETFSRRGYLAKEHLPALRSNLVLLRHFGVTRFVVHVRDPRQSILSLTRILDFYDITGKQVTLPQLEKGQLHFRKGETDEWRQVFTPEQIECAGKSIPEYLRERFLWPAH